MNSSREAPETWSALESAGWRIDGELGRETFAALSPGASLNVLKQAVLDSDLRKIGAAALPEDINRTAQASLQGPLVLQIVAVDDISRPSRVAAESDSSAGRLLRLKLTDGKLTATCAELRPVPHLSADIAPGTKVLLKGKAQVRSGIILLEPKTVEVLGGRVEALAEAWEMQRKYGGLQRARPAGEGADELPPPFEQFAVGRAPRAPVAALEAPRRHPEAAGEGAAGAARGGGKDAGRKGRRATGARGGHAEAADSSADGRRAAPQRPLPVDAEPRCVPAGASGGAAGRRPAPAEKAGSGPTSGPGGGAPNQERLMQKLQAGEQSRREAIEERRQRRQAGRQRRRGAEDADWGGDPGTMTLEEWEARRSARRPAGPPAQVDSDEQLARQLQRQMDLELASGPPPAPQRQGNSLAEELRSSLFSFEQAEAPDAPRGRGGRRGGRGPGRGRGARRGRGPR